MKKFIVFLLITVFVFSLIPVTVLANGDINVTVDGRTVEFVGQRPVVVDGRTLVPIRGVFEMLGFEVNWNDATQQAILTRDDNIISIAIGSSTFSANGVDHVLEVRAQTINGRTMLPLRGILESIGYSVSWDEVTRTIPVTRAGSVGGVRATQGLEQFSFIPDFAEVSDNALLIGSGVPAYFNFAAHAIENFEIVFIYDLQYDYFNSEAERYDELLIRQGFILQDVRTVFGFTTARFYHPGRSVSLHYEYDWDVEFLVILIGRGNAFEQMGDRTHVTVDSQIVGSWTSATRTLRFFADGTGVVETLNNSGAIISSEAFTWSSYGGLMTYRSGPFERTSWLYSVSDAYLTLTSEDGETLTYSLLRP